MAKKKRRILEAYCPHHQVLLPCNICDRLVTVTKPGQAYEAIVPWEDKILHSESGEWLQPTILVVENGTYWYEDTNGKALVDGMEAHGFRQDFRKYRKSPIRHCEMKWVTGPRVKGDALATELNPDIRVPVTEEIQEDCVDRANHALQAMRAFERTIADKLVLTDEERQKRVQLNARVQETQADVMIAVRNRSWQRAGIAPGMRNPRIAHVHVDNISQLPEALKEALKKKLGA